MDYRNLLLFPLIGAILYIGITDNMDTIVALTRTPRGPAPYAVADAPSILIEHSKEFEKKIHKVTDGVYSAVGYGLANSILLEGDDGLVIVDTLESKPGAAEVWKEFRKISDKPLKGIIYTHFHNDHNGGTESFLVDNTSVVEIFSHDTTLDFVNVLIGKTNEIAFRRAMGQFGALLKPPEFINCGIGPFLANGHGAPTGFVPPTRTFADKLEVNIGGLDLVLYHAPGETEDQIVVWVPSKKVLCAADNIYRSFPNIYAIRGTRTRDVRKWVASLRFMKSLRPDFLAPSHSRPVEGAEFIQNLLTDYADAMLYVRDQTIRWMNHGKDPDEIVSLVRLPKELEEHPFLQPFYGTVPWSVRAVFFGEMGWFNGKAKDLNPLAPVDYANELMKLAGDFRSLWQFAKQAFGAQQYQWSLELVESLILLQDQAQPKLNKTEKQELITLKIESLQQLAVRQVPATGRNYYLTEAKEVGGMEIAPTQQDQEDIFRTFDIRNVFTIFAVRLNPEKCKDNNRVVFIVLKDQPIFFRLHVRNRVCVVSDYPYPHYKPNAPAEPEEKEVTTFRERLTQLLKREPSNLGVEMRETDIVVTLDKTSTFADLVFKPARTAVKALASGKMRVEGEKHYRRLVEFFSWFDLPHITRTSDEDTEETTDN